MKGQKIWFIRQDMNISDHFLQLHSAGSLQNPMTSVSVISSQEEKTGNGITSSGLLQGLFLFHTDYSFYGDKYYVLKEGDEIIAGVCAIPSSYKVL